MNDLNFKNKIYGALYGCAIGDALGLATEFMSKEEVALRYPDGITDYSQIYPDAHRKQWDNGNWTADTEIVLSLIDTIAEAGQYDLNAIAGAFKAWYECGHYDIAPQYRFIFRHPEYSDKPEEVSLDVWNEMGACDASNEANGRAVFTGMLRINHLDRTAHICRVTHPDPRCIGSCMALGQMAHDLTWHNTPTPPDEIKAIVSGVDEGIVPYVNMALESTLDSLDLDDEDTLWYTRKNMGAALWAVWHGLTPMEAFSAIASEGGDADTNASSALSLLGIVYGPDGFPPHLREGLTWQSRLEESAARWHGLFKTKYGVE